MIYDFKIVNRQLSIVNCPFLIGKRSREPRQAFPLRETFPRTAASFPTSGNVPANRGGFSHFGKRPRGFATSFPKPGNVPAVSRRAFPLRETFPRTAAGFPTSGNDPASRGGFSHFGKRLREPRRVFPLRETLPRFCDKLSLAGKCSSGFATSFPKPGNVPAVSRRAFASSETVPRFRAELSQPANPV